MIWGWPTSSPATWWSAFAALDARGHLFYTARVTSGWATFRREATGGGSTLVAADVWRAIPSPDASFVIGRHRDLGLMRVNTDGSGATVILQDASTAPIAFTPDGAGFVFVSNRSGPQQPWLLPLSGGEATRLSDAYIGDGRPWLSVDGREVIFSTLELIAGPFSADGKTVFAVDPNDPRTILAQPIDGSVPTPHFTDKEIADLSLSPDRTRIAITRLPGCRMSC